MKYCTRCVMPDTRPGITFDDKGVCAGCRTVEKKASVDWDARFKELEALCDRYRGKGVSGYDCIIAVSGGKDSHFQVHTMKERLGMTPLLVTVEDNFPMTEAGKHNIRNISEVFGCEIIALKPNLRAQKRIMRKTFEKYGKPTWYLDRLIYTYPVHMALNFRIPLLVYGENVSYEYGGDGAVESYSARNQITNGVASDIPYEELTDELITERDLILCTPPTAENLDKIEFNPIYLSYFVKWNSFSNYYFAKSAGFHDLSAEWKRQNHVEDFDQVESRAYLVHPWMKYPKFGHAAATDYASRMVRYGMITREEAVALVKEHDAVLDPLMVRDFCDFLGYSEREFWAIADTFYNPELFIKNELGQWVLK